MHLCQDPTKANAICQSGPSYEQKVNCVIGAVKDIIWIGNSKPNGEVLCNLQTEEPIKQTCLSTAEDYYRTFK